MPRSSRWTGLSRDDRHAERRRLLVEAAYELFGEGGEAAVTVRSVCRRSELHSRYFYESFADTDELLGAVYDRVAAELLATLDGADSGMADARARLAAGIRTVLDFSSRDPRRGKVLFTEARTNPVLAQRRSAAEQYVRESVLDEHGSKSSDARLAELVGAAMYAGAMAELAQQWLAGSLGTDLEPVVDAAVRMLMPAGAGR